MKEIIRLSILLITLISINSVSSQTLNKKIDSIAQATLIKSGSVGAYLSIIKGGSVIYSSPFGYNDIKTKSQLNDSTVFPISSNTKAFNSILLSQLVEQNKLNFNIPLKSYLPGLEFKNEFITNNINLTDLLTHRWGIPRYDFTYYSLTEKEKECGNQAVFNKLKYLEGTASFRTQFQYGNNQYILASYLLETITGKKWEDQLNSEILHPLKMTDTHCDLNAFLKSDNKSIGYQDNSHADIMLAAPLYDVSGMGNMFSTVRDLEKWCSFLLNGNDSILSKELISHTYKSQFNIGYEEPYDGFSNMTYGLGWFIFDYYGHKVVLHHGDNIGHQSIIVLLPEDNLSWVIIQNEGMKSYGFPFRMTYSLLDLFLEKEQNDWNEILTSKAYDAYKYPDSLQPLNTKLSLKISEYPGEYYHDGFGKISVYLNDSKLIVSVGRFTEELTHWENNAFKATSFEFKEDYIFSFILNDNNEITSLKTDLIEPTVDLIEFEKRD